jgi:hypothetical protein
MEAKLFRAANFEGVIHRGIKRSPANRARDIVGGPVLYENGRQADCVAFLDKGCNAFHDFKELRYTHN